MTRSRAIKSLAFVVLSVTYTQCWMNSKANDTTVDRFNRNLTDYEHAFALIYQPCTSCSGSERESFDWATFSQQFSAWLLPWLALISQLPFGAESNLDNLISSMFPSRDHQCILPSFLLPCTSRPHCRVSHPCSILARPYSPQHSLGLQSFLSNQPPQSPEDCQGCCLPPTGSTAYNHP